MNIKKRAFENNLISLNIAAFIAGFIILVSLFSDLPMTIAYDVHDDKPLIFLVRNIIFFVTYVVVMKKLGSKLKDCIFNVCSISLIIFIYNLVFGRFIVYFGYYRVYYYLLKYLLVLLCGFIIFKYVNKKMKSANGEKKDNYIMFAYNNLYFNLMMFVLLIAKLIMRWEFAGI